MSNYINQSDIFKQLENITIRAFQSTKLTDGMFEIGMESNYVIETVEKITLLSQLTGYEINNEFIISYKDFNGYMNKLSFTEKTVSYFKAFIKKILNIK